MLLMAYVSGVEEMKALKHGDKCILTQKYLEFVEDKVSDLHFSFLNKTLTFDRYENGCAFVFLDRGFKVVGENDVIALELRK